MNLISSSTVTIQLSEMPKPAAPGMGSFLNQENEEATSLCYVFGNG